jgi:fumarate reductase subunit D
MNPETLFGACNKLALLAWLVLIFAGRRRWASGLVTAVFVPAVLALVYSVLIPLHWRDGDGNFNTLSGVAALFANRWLLLAGWLHYLAFDLFVGSWEVRDAMRNRIPHWAVIPSLILTFLFGPAGLLSYFVLRLAIRHKFGIEESAGAS